MKKKIQQIDADTWAESGGTGGIFGSLWRKGLLEIVPVPKSGKKIVPDMGLRGGKNEM